MGKSISILDKDYIQWVKELSSRYRRSQIKAAVKVNEEMLRFCWELGRDITEKKAESRWGSGFMKNLSKYLKELNPGATCFSQTNLLYMKNFYQLYQPCTEITPQFEEQIAQQVVEHFQIAFAQQVVEHSQYMAYTTDRSSSCTEDLSVRSSLHQGSILLNPCSGFS